MRTGYVKVAEACKARDPRQLLVPVGGPKVELNSRIIVQLNMQALQPRKRAGAQRSRGGDRGATGFTGRECGSSARPELT